MNKPNYYNKIWQEYKKMPQWDLIKNDEAKVNKLKELVFEKHIASLPNYDPENEEKNNKAWGLMFNEQKVHPDSQEIDEDYALTKKGIVEKQASVYVNDEGRKIFGEDSNLLKRMYTSFMNGYRDIIYKTKISNAIMSLDEERTDKLLENYNKFREGQAMVETDNWWEDMWVGLSGTAGMMLDIGVKSAAVGMTAGGVAALAGQAGPQVLVPEELITVPTTIATATTAAFLSHQLGMGETVVSLLDEGVDKDIAKKIGFIAGIPYGIAEQSQILKIPGIKGATNKVLKTFGKKANKIVLDYIADRGKDYVTENIEEIAQELVVIGAEELGKIVQNSYREGNLDKATYKETMNRLLETAKQSALSFLPLMVGGSFSPNKIRQVKQGVHAGKLNEYREKGKQHIDSVDKFEKQLLDAGGEFYESWKKTDLSGWVNFVSAKYDEYLITLGKEKWNEADIKITKEQEKKRDDVAWVNKKLYWEEGDLRSDVGPKIKFENIPEQSKEEEIIGEDKVISDFADDVDVDVEKEIEKKQEKKLNDIEEKKLKKKLDNIDVDDTDTDVDVDKLIDKKIDEALENAGTTLGINKKEKKEIKANIKKEEEKKNKQNVNTDVNVNIDTDIDDLLEKQIEKRLENAGVRIDKNKNENENEKITNPKKETENLTIHDYKLNDNVKIEFTDKKIETKRKDDVSAKFDRETKTIIINKKVAKQKFEEKAWTKSKVKGVLSLPTNVFKKYEDWERFLIQHENAHSELTKIKNQAARENKANEIALIELMKHKKSKGENVKNIVGIVNRLIQKNKNIDVNAKDNLSKQEKSKPIETKEIKIEIIDIYDNNIVKNNQDKIYVFGDNLAKKGKGGQAIIRDNKNAFGIPTKKLPNNTQSSFMNDREFDKNKKAIDSAIDKIKEQNKIVVFPKDGLGTGLAKLSEKAPKTWTYLNKRLKEEFGYENKIETDEVFKAKSINKEFYSLNDDSPIIMYRGYALSEDREAQNLEETIGNSASDYNDNFEGALYFTDNEEEAWMYAKGRTDKSKETFVRDGQVIEQENRHYTGDFAKVSEYYLSKTAKVEIYDDILDYNKNHKDTKPDVIILKSGTLNPNNTEFVVLNKNKVEIKTKFDKQENNKLKKIKQENITASEKEKGLLYYHYGDNIYIELFKNVIDDFEVVAWKNLMDASSNGKRIEEKSFETENDAIKYANGIIDKYESISEPKTETKPNIPKTKNKPLGPTRTNENREIDNNIETKKDFPDILGESDYQLKQKGEQNDLEYIGEIKSDVGDYVPIYKVINKDSEFYDRYMTPKEISKTNLKYPEHEKIKDNSALHKKAENMIKKRFPKLKIKNVNGLIKENGLKAVGKAIHDTIYISDNGYVDTPIHESVHLWLKLLGKNDPIIRQGINLFVDKKINKKDALEKLVNKISQDTVTVLRGESSKDKFKRWLRMFYLHVKKIFGKLTDKEAAQYISDLYWIGYKAKDVGTLYTNEEYFQQEENIEDNENAKENGENENSDNDITDASKSTDVLNYWNNIAGDYLSINGEKTIHKLAVDNYYNIEEGIKQIKKYLDKNYPNHTFNPERISDINRVKQLALLMKNSIQLAYTDENKSALKKPGRVRMMFVMGGYYGRATFPANPEWNIVQELPKKNPATNKENPLRELMSFYDDDMKYFKDDRKRIHLVRTSDIIIRHKNKNGEVWYEKGNFQFTENNVNLLQSYFEQKHKKGARMFYFLTGKGGDTSTMFLAAVPKNILSLEKEEIKNVFKKQFDDGYITETWYNSILKELNDDAYNKKYPHNPQILLARYREIQKIKGLYWTHYTPSVQELFNRMRHDLGTGKTIFGLKNQKAMFFNSETDYVAIRDKNGKLGKKISMKDIDGAIWSSRDRFRQIENIIGRVPETKDGSHMYSLKTAIRELGDNLIDYVMIKGMEFSAFEGMEFYRNDEKVPFVKEKDGNFFDSEGNKIDLITDSQSIKQSYGKFKKLYEIIDLNERSTKLLIPDKERGSDNAAHPTMYYEQLFSESINENLYNDVVKNFKKFIKELDDTSFTGLILKAENSPQFLRQLFLSRAKKNELPTSLQHIMQHDKSGKSLYSPTYLPQIINVVKNRIFVDGLFKVRIGNGKGGSQAFKPDVTGTLKDNECYFSNEMLNLENNHISKNNGLIVDARVPIINPHAVTFVVPKGTLNGHGNNIVIYNANVAIEIKEGDYDGDKSNMVILPKYLTDSLIKLHKDEKFLNRKKPFYVQAFKSMASESVPAGSKAIAKGIASNSISDGSQGIFVNAKVLSNSFFRKDLTLKINGREYKVRGPESEFLMKHDVDLDWLEKNPEKFKEMKKHGEFVKTKDGETYYKTTFENALQFYTQMAVDNPKYGHLSTIGFNGLDYTISRMFYDTKNKDLTIKDKNVIKALKEVYRLLNINNIRNKKMTIQDYFVEIKKLYNLYNLSPEKQGEYLYQISNFNDKKFKNINIEISVNGNESFGETVLLQTIRTTMEFRKKEEARFDELQNKIQNNEELTDYEKKEYMTLAYKELSYDEDVPLLTRSNAVERYSSYYVVTDWAERILNKNLKNPFSVKFKKNIGKGNVLKNKKKATSFARNVSREYRELLIKLEKIENNLNFSFDKNLEVRKFIENWKPKFDEMTEMEQFLSSLYYVAGMYPGGDMVKGRQKLLPHQLMDKDVLVQYGKDVYNLRNNGKMIEIGVNGEIKMKKVSANEKNSIKQKIDRITELVEREC